MLPLGITGWHHRADRQVTAVDTPVAYPLLI
jgi:hypothetical protein